MGDRIIQTADLSRIHRILDALYERINDTNQNVSSVGSRVDGVQRDLTALQKEFDTFVRAQQFANRAQKAETRLVKVRQEIDQKFGHYDVIRRTTKGILQASDLGIVRKETITTATEELMLRTPEYWLAPALVALSAWISAKEDIAARALAEGLRRDDEKTSLLFALICRRAGRMAASILWAHRYLAAQDETQLDRKAILIIDAYASGLLGRDAEGSVKKQLDAWIERLSDAPDFIETQEQQWKNAILLLRPAALDGDPYPYLRAYSETWDDLERAMCGAQLHQKLYDHFKNIFEKKPALRSLVQELDRILDSLVTNFDDAELPLRTEETLEQLVAQCNGDEAKARQIMDTKKKSLQPRRDFMQLITDAAMNPKEAGANVTTQKMAIALSRDWILTAYRDIVAAHRMAVPDSITCTVGTWRGTTRDGENEAALLAQYAQHLAGERDAALSALHLSRWDRFCQWGGVIPLLLGLYFGIPWGLIIGGVIGLLMFLSYRGSVSSIERQRQALILQYEEQLAQGSEIIRAVLAETLDYRDAFAAADSGDRYVVDFLAGLSPAQFMLRLSETERRVQR